MNPWYLIVGFSLLLLLLQFNLWGTQSGVSDLEDSIVKQIELNQQIEACNRELRAEVIDLKSGREALEERARSDLGMVKPGEIFISLAEDSATPRHRQDQRGQCEQVIQ